MDVRDEVELKGLLDKFIIEAQKTIKLIDTLTTRANELAVKGKNITIPEIKQNVTKLAKSELQDLTEKLVSINIDLELDYIDTPDLVIPYFVPGEIQQLTFLSGENPWNFWLIDNTQDIKGLLKILWKKHQNGLLYQVKKPKAAQSVCFIDRNKVLRGVILQIKNESRVKLVDCDSNVTKIVPSEKLFKVDEEACHIRASALRCTITEDPVAIELWKNADLRDIFCNTLREATLNVKIVKRVDGSFPMFVVDVELQNEDEDICASLNEWILDRLVPKLKKLDTSENESLCDYLSEESLSPYYKDATEKILKSEESHPMVFEGNENLDQAEKATPIQKDQLNSLNYSQDKLSEEIVANLIHCKEENTTCEDNISPSENVPLTCTEHNISSSSSCDELVTSGSRNLLSSNFLNKPDFAAAVADSKLNCESKEFRPKAKNSDNATSNIKLENRKNQPHDNHPHPSYGPMCSMRFPPHQVPRHDQPWPYVDQPTHQATNWPYHHQVARPPVWPPGQDPAFNLVNPDSTKVSNVNTSNNVNVLAAEFVPKKGVVQQSRDIPRVEIPSEPVTLRRSATLYQENETFPVMISHVENPSEFYVHFIIKNNAHMDKLDNEMMRYYSSREKIEFDSCKEARSKLGKFCACLWPEDNHWYRVEVLDWAVGNNMVNVWFVDHGNKDCVHLSCLQPLNKMFEKLPICSQACHLAKVFPTIKGQPWSQDAIDFLKSKIDVVNSHVFTVTVVQSNQIKSNSLAVLLYKGNATDIAQSLNHLLVQQGLAWSRSLSVEPASSVSSENYHSMDDLSDKGSINLPTLTCDMQMPSTDNCHDLVQNVHPYEPIISSPTPLNLENGTELYDDAFEHWDPRKEDFESVRNNPSLDTDNACVAISRYCPKDEARICKFYAREGFCFKSVCYKEHSMPRPDGITTDKEEIYSEAFSQLELPVPGEVVRLKVTHIENLNIFYVQIEEKRGIAIDDEFKDEAETLTSLEKYMNNPDNVMKMKYLTTSPGIGELVLAREVGGNGAECWYRARVTGVSDQDDPEVMFVDYGTTSTVSERDLRKMENKFLHLPFQAIECSLANVEPVMDNVNMKRGTDLLREMLTGQVVTAKVYESEDDTDDVVRLQVSLKLSNGMDVGDLLIESDICQPRLV